MGKKIVVIPENVIQYFYAYMRVCIPCVHKIVRARPTTTYVNDAIKYIA